MLRSYAELLRLPGASAAAVPAALARLAGTMVPLALLLALVQSDRPVAVAGGAGAVYALGNAVGGPLIGRLMDRRGPASVLRITGPVAGGLLAAAALGASRAPTGVLFAAACCAGLATAPVGASARAMWQDLTEDEELRKRAYAFESTLSELLFVLGPSAVSALGWLLGARSALLATAVLLGAGAVGYGQAGIVRRRAPMPRRAHEPGGAAGRDTRRGAAALSVLAAIALTAALSSALAVAVTVALRAQGSAPELAGSLVALQSVGSVVGGLLYGARNHGGSTFRRYVRLLVILTLALAVLPSAVLAHRAGLSEAWTLVLLGGLLALSGLPMAPAGAEEFQLIGDMTARHRMTEAFAGVGSFIAVGGAVGSALTGAIADTAGPVTALTLPAACTCAALLLTLAARRPIAAAVAAAREEDRVRSATPDPESHSHEH
ncbi:MFS transporter [Streptomyces sp. NPDC093546]|uniref:MFS transporter n=1 Tax=Streptomyces sp. NPDC093546 TaxID=3366040 RepID=UPI003814B1C1